MIKEKDSLLVAAFLHSLGKSNLENEITNTVRYLDVFNEKRANPQSNLIKKVKCIISCSSCWV